MKWTNWSGSVKSEPIAILYPSSEDEIMDIVKNAIVSNQKIRMVGSGHSFSKILETKQVLVSLDKMQGIISHDFESQTATVWAGTKLKKLGDLLFDIGLAQENMGDINVQSIAGALSTGTHGTGSKLGTLSTQIVEITFINGRGQLQMVNEQSDKTLFDAIRVSLGAIGIFTRVKIRLDKCYRLAEVTQKESLNNCLNQLEVSISENRNFEFFWFPHTDTVQTKFLNKTEEPFRRPGLLKKAADLLVENWLFHALSSMARVLPGFSKRVAKISAWGISNGNFVDWSHNIYATSRSVKFNEMEYNVPIEYFKTALLELKELIEKEEIDVHFPIECRFVKKDDIMISPAYNRTAAYIAVHQFKGMPYEAYFKKSEAIFKKYNGRPHWGKINYLSESDFSALYLKWKEFKEIQKMQDPNGLFLNDYLDKLFTNDP
ncbi:MAG: FAD-binding protein [Crocinitomicaceae bacterium]|nr:FAD-binding protein [Crocinitomicaceae bacterium]